MMMPEDHLYGFDHSLLHWIKSYIATLPEEGMLLGDFKADCLDGVSISDRSSVVEMLKKAELIFVARDGAHWNVYKSKPDYAGLAKAHDDLIDAFIADAAPYVRSIRRAIDAQGGATDRGGAERVRKAARRLTVFTRRQIGKGVQFDSLRRELWLTFSHDVISRAAECDSGFGRDATLIESNADWPAFGRIGRGIPFSQVILRHVERVGLQGITVAELRKSLHGALSSFRIEEFIDKLEAQGQVQSAVMKLDSESRRTRRVFTASMGLPYVRDDGVATWGAV